MKHLLITTAMLAALTGAAAANTTTPTYTLPNNGTQTADAAAAAIIVPKRDLVDFGFTVEGGYIYNTESEGIDCYGGRASFDFYLAPTKRLHHQFSIAAGYYYGSDDYEGTYKKKVWYNGDKYVPAQYINQTVRGTMKMELTQIPVSFGYALHININKYLTLIPNVKVGYTKAELSYEGDDSEYDCSGMHAAIGFAIRANLSSFFIQSGVEYGWVDMDDAVNTVQGTLGFGFRF